MVQVDKEAVVVTEEVLTEKPVNVETEKVVIEKVDDAAELVVNSKLEEEHVIIPSDSGQEQQPQLVVCEEEKPQLISCDLGQPPVEENVEATVTDEVHKIAEDQAQEIKDENVNEGKTEVDANKEVCDEANVENAVIEDAPESSQNKNLDEQKEVLCDEKLESNEVQNVDVTEETPKLAVCTFDNPENTEPEIAVCTFDMPTEILEINNETVEVNTKQESPDQNNATIEEQHLPQSVDDKNLAENTPTEEKVQQPETEVLKNDNHAED